MKLLNKIILLMLLSYFCMGSDLYPLTERYFHDEDLGYNYTRGEFLIVIPSSDLETILRDETTGDYIYFKQTQGYHVKIITLDQLGIPLDDPASLKSYLKYYMENESIFPIEYVLLIGDINGSYKIPTFTIPSYNENELDVTDYEYSYFDDSQTLSPSFHIGRWPIRSNDDLKKIKSRSIQYILMENVPDSTYLNNALIVAGNYSDLNTWPVTPMWTSMWLSDNLKKFGYNEVDTVYFHLGNQTQYNPQIHNSWNSGVGVINYRGWGDANGWHYPYFHREDIDNWLNNGWYLPIVMSFVCNTGDFGNDYSGSGLSQSFGEYMITAGTINNPKGAAAMVGPSDLDTDTRFNNVMCAVMWDELLEGRIPELALALHAGKQALIKEFGSLEENGTNIVNFYHHVYGVIGDPSLPVWLKMPNNMQVALENNIISNDSIEVASPFIKIDISNELGESLNDVVGSLLYNREIVAKGISNHNGELLISFDNINVDSSFELYLNKPNYFQKKINVNFSPSLEDEPIPSLDYIIPSNDISYDYTVSQTDYNWIEINQTGSNLNLVDDSLTDIQLKFDFQYFGTKYREITVCSNGWISFLPCLSSNGLGGSSDCAYLPYFANNSIPHPLGPYGLVAPFYDDLDDDQGKEPFNVYFWTNELDSAIIEWDDVANGETDENCSTSIGCEKEKFQLILVSSATPNNNGNIIFQYKNIHDIDDNGSTIGIESPDKNWGVQYLFNYNYIEGAPILENGTGIIFSSNFICDLGFDECGVCGGDNSCLDCAGTPNGEAELDCLGVCDGTALIDCLGECGGAAIIDECGICNGNGTSCLYNNEIFIPETFGMQSYPNPFNPIVNIDIDVPSIDKININIFDINGRDIKQITNEYYNPGKYSFVWDATQFSSGIYIIKVSNKKESLFKKVIMLK